MKLNNQGVYGVEGTQTYTLMIDEKYGQLVSTNV